MMKKPKGRNNRKSKKRAPGKARERERELLLLKEEVARLNQELEETNLGVVALYAELEEKAEQLQSANEMKTRFLSIVNHEIRTPINSILSLSGILLDRLDGDLTAEQEKQVVFIRRAGQGLSELVNGLLDIAKIEAGKVEVHPSDFDVHKMFDTLYGMMAPLNVNPSVSLIFEDPLDIPLLKTDEYKVNQILRNLVSNAIKFTERGEIRVSAKTNDQRDSVIFSVADTGTGIKPEDQGRIFEEFAQLEGHLQRKFKGTGLGLPLSRKLAELLGGSISISSEPGVGSTFTVVLPVNFEKERQQAPPVFSPQPEPVQPRLLVITKNPEVLPLYEEYLADMALQVLPAVSIENARQMLKRLIPAGIVLHLHSPKTGCWNFLSSIKQDPLLKDVPFLVVASAADRQKSLSLGADAFCAKPIKGAWLLDRLKTIEPKKTVLIIDDEPVSRYTFKKLLAFTRYAVSEAGSGQEGLQMARVKPDVIFLDLVMPGMDGYETLERLKANPETGDIPVIIYTGTELDQQEREKLEREAAAVLFKKDISRKAIIEQINRALGSDN